jgi:hypothetical protein
MLTVFCLIRQTVEFLNQLLRHFLDFVSDRLQAPLNLPKAVCERFVVSLAFSANTP